MSERKTGVRAYKNALEEMKKKMAILEQKFENGTLLDFEEDIIIVLGQEIREKEQELHGL